MAHGFSPRQGKLLVDGPEVVVAINNRAALAHCGKSLLARTAFVRQINDLERRNVRQREETR
jgi:hypothetical protein